MVRNMGAFLKKKKKQNATAIDTDVAATAAAAAAIVEQHKKKKEASFHKKKKNSSSRWSPMRTRKAAGTPIRNLYAGSSTASSTASSLVHAVSNNLLGTLNVVAADNIEVVTADSQRALFEQREQIRKKLFETNATADATADAAAEAPPPPPPAPSAPASAVAAANAEYYATPRRGQKLSASQASMPIATVTSHGGNTNNSWDDESLRRGGESWDGSLRKITEEQVEYATTTVSPVNVSFHSWDNELHSVEVQVTPPRAMSLAPAAATETTTTTSGSPQSASSSAPFLANNNVSSSSSNYYPATGTAAAVDTSTTTHNGISGMVPRRGQQGDRGAPAAALVSPDPAAPPSPSLAGTALSVGGADASTQTGATGAIRDAAAAALFQDDDETEDEDSNNNNSIEHTFEESNQHWASIMASKENEVPGGSSTTANKSAAPSGSTSDVASLMRQEGVTTKDTTQALNREDGHGNSLTSNTSHSPAASLSTARTYTTGTTGLTGLTEDFTATTTGPAPAAGLARTLLNAATACGSAAAAGVTKDKHCGTTATVVENDDDDDMDYTSLQDTIDTNAGPGGGPVASSSAPRQRPPPRRPTYLDESSALRFLRRIVKNGFVLLYLQQQQKAMMSDNDNNNKDDHDEEEDWAGRTVTVQIVQGQTAPSPWDEHAPSSPQRRGGDGGGGGDGRSGTTSSRTVLPRLEWVTVAGGQAKDVIVQSVGLLDISSIEIDSANGDSMLLLNDGNDPNGDSSNVLENSCFFTVTTDQGDVHIFEAATVEERDRIVNGLRTIVARWCFHIMAGDPTATCELFVPSAMQHNEKSSGSGSSSPNKSHRHWRNNKNAAAEHEHKDRLPTLANPIYTMNTVAHALLDAQ